MIYVMVMYLMVVRPVRPVLRYAEIVGNVAQSNTLLGALNV